MALIEIKTRKKKKIRIALVEEEDYKQLTKKRFYFSWKLFKTQADIKVYKLQLINDDDILGVMALGNFVDESRIEINLLACSVENVGVKKMYEGVAGSLIAYACRLANMQYGRNACVSLVPKTRLKQHYINQYGMVDAGWQLFLEGSVLNDMILKYLL